MSASETYLYSINRVINIDNGSATKNTIVGLNADDIYSNLRDNNITEQFRVVGGTWTDTVVSQKIVPHNDSQGLDNGVLSVGYDSNTINVNGTTLKFGSDSKTGSTTDINGKTISLGETDSTVDTYGDEITVGKNNTHANAIFDESGESITIGTSSLTNLTLSGLTSKFNADTLYVNETDNGAYMKFDKSGGIIDLGKDGTNILNLNGLTTTVLADTKFEVGTSGSNVQITADNTGTGTLDLGNNLTGDINIKGTNTSVNAANFSLDGTTQISIGSSGTTMDFTSATTTSSTVTKTQFYTPDFQIDNTASNVYFKMDNSSKLIEIGCDNTDDIVSKGKTTKVNAATKIQTDTPLLELQNSSSNVYVKMDENNKLMQIGNTNTDDVVAYGKTTKIYATTQFENYTPDFQVQTSGSNVYFKMDEASKLMQIGSDTTDDIVAKGKITKISAATKIQTDTPLLEFQNNSSNVYFKMDESAGSVYVGSDQTTLFDVNADTTNIKSSSSYKINSVNDGAYLFLDNTNSNISLGTDNTSTTTIKGDTVTIEAPTSLNLSTNSFIFNDASDKARFELDDANSIINIGGSALETTRIHGSNVIIGEAGCTTTIYGNLIAYSQGSNIITHTATQETSAFVVHNSGTQPAMYVIQDNTVGTNENLAVFVTSSNQDRAPLRIDGDGRVGLGLPQKEHGSNYDLKAWLHVNRNDPNGTVYHDIMRIDDTDNDATPFIIKNNGDVGIGTYAPEYKLDVHKDASGSSGIALRDTLYIKQNNVNRISYCMANLKYEITDVTAECMTGFELKWDTTGKSTIYNTTDGSYVFRVSCKFHISREDGNIAFRKFEIFVNPQDGTFNSKQTPSHVAVTDVFDTVRDSFEFVQTVPEVVRTGPEKCELRIKWKSTSTLLTDANDNKCRVYLDMDILSHQDLGDIDATVINSISSNKGAVTTN